MADVIFSEVLCYLNKNIKRMDKTTLLETICKFYHEDELYDAKSELCKIAAALPSGESNPDGWAKFVNTKGVAVLRRSTDGAQRRRSEADDLIQMLMILDVNKVVLPKFVIGDPDRVPSGLWTLATTGSPASTSDSAVLVMVQEVMTKFTETMNAIVQRLDNLEMKWTCTTTPANMAPTRKALQEQLPVTSTSSESRALDEVYNTVSRGTEQYAASATWAEQAKDLAAADPRLVFRNPRPSVRMRGQALTGAVKAVPRQLTCFVSRLNLDDVTEDELSKFLHSQGILDVSCRKIAAKDGRVFRTSAFRVSCSSRFESLFYDESLWPEGAELRDWVFYTNNGRR
jgi:hypothetical protein